MGITVVLENGRGDPLVTVEDVANVLHGVLPSAGDDRFPYLSTIDWYGDTVFNRLQARGFLAEWRRLDLSTLSTSERELVGSIEALARRLASDVHVYLKFHGD